MKVSVFYPGKENTNYVVAKTDCVRYQTRMHFDHVNKTPRYGIENVKLSGCRVPNASRPFSD